MSARTQIVTAIRRFDDWSRPWLFARSVTEWLSVEDGELFEEVWAEAGDKKHWLDASDLPSGMKTASDALSSRFPWLLPDAVNALANAAAYNWR